MTQMYNRSQRIHKTKNGLALGLVINWLVPVILYTVLRNFIKNDTITFALVTVIPVVRTIFMFLLRHRIDWIGVFGALGFAVALAVSAVFGGSSLPLKLYHPILTGMLGAIFLFSALIGKPILISILKVIKRVPLEQLDDPKFRKRITMMSAVLGILLLLDALVHIIMAFTLSTGAFLGMSRLVTIVILVIVVGLKWLNSRRILN
jgi:hypothetical protein